MSVPPIISKQEPLRTVPATLIEPLDVDRTEIRDTLVELREECVGFSDFVEELLDQLDESRKEVEGTARLLERERQALLESQRLWQQQQAEGAVAQEVDATRIVAVEKEREELERELELLRKRAAKMAETLSEQQREMAAERADWTGELMSMRTLLEQHSKMIETHPVSATPASPDAERAGTDTSSADPVIDSVIAQIEQLHRAELTANRENVTDA